MTTEAQRRTPFVTTPKSITSCITSLRNGSIPLFFRTHSVRCCCWPTRTNAANQRRKQMYLWTNPIPCDTTPDFLLRFHLKGKRRESKKKLQRAEESRSRREHQRKKKTLHSSSVSHTQTTSLPRIKAAITFKGAKTKIWETHAYFNFTPKRKRERIELSVPRRDSQ